MCGAGGPTLERQPQLEQTARFRWAPGSSASTLSPIGPQARCSARAPLPQERLFDLWHRYRREEIGRRELRREAGKIVSRLKQKLRSASRTEHKDAQTLSKELLKHWPKLWTFLRFEGVEPTNNSAERALRPLVILKRIVQRLPSARGKAFFERMATGGATARLRGIPFFQWLLKAIHAAHQGTPLTSLEPT